MASRAAGPDRTRGDPSHISAPTVLREARVETCPLCPSAAACKAGKRRQRSALCVTRFIRSSNQSVRQSWVLSILPPTTPSAVLRSRSPVLERKEAPLVMTPLPAKLLLPDTDIASHLCIARWHRFTDAASVQQTMKAKAAGVRCQESPTSLQASPAFRQIIGWPGQRQRSFILSP